MTGGAAVVALVSIEWAAGLLGAAGWTQSWSVVRRGHFRIVAWSAIPLAALAYAAHSSATPGGTEGLRQAVAIACLAGAACYLLLQYARTDLPGAVAGYAGALAGAVWLVSSAGLIQGWPRWLAALGLLSGGALLGAVTNGMLLGHWYLNQPGLKPWALARLTRLALAATAASAAAGVAATGRLTAASTEGAVLGLPGFGESFAGAFFAIWLGLVGFTAVVVWMARRCVKLRSIQSATGLYYVALLTAGVSEFLARYLMVSGA